jgi:hypothetical protein
MIHGLLWLPLVAVFVLLTALGWLERRRQQLFRAWASGAELAKLDACGAARLIDGMLSWCRFESGSFQEHGTFPVKQLEMVELLSLRSGEAPLTEESQGACRLRLVGSGRQEELPFADAQLARRWMDQLMSLSRCDL